MTLSPPVPPQHRPQEEDAREDEETQFIFPDGSDETDRLFFPEHEKYKQRLIKSQKLANEKKKRTQICWRGYRTAVKPGQANLEDDEDTLNGMLITALKNIKKISSDEEKVKE